MGHAVRRQQPKDSISLADFGGSVNIRVETERDRRTLEWLVSQVGADEVDAACLKLAGQRRHYVSNVARVLGLVPPEAVHQTESVQARKELARLKSIIKTSRT